MIAAGLFLLALVFWFLSGMAAGTVPNKFSLRKNADGEDEEVVVTNTIDRATAPDNMDKIALSLRIMPS